MKIKLWIISSTMLVGLSALSFKKSKSKTNMNSMVEQQVKSEEGAQNYQKNYKQFTYYIESIGMVSIDKVELDKLKLTAHYSYKLANEVRHVVSVLTMDDDGIYKGTCTTKVKGEIIFAVNTWLTFTKDGTALGNWSWSGTPTKNDPIVTISKI